jgi:hypothetical protein
MSVGIIHDADKFEFNIFLNDPYREPDKDISIG